MPDAATIRSWCRCRISLPGHIRLVLFLLVLTGATGARAQEWTQGQRYARAAGEADTIAPPVMREFRAAWLATVSNIDWPSRPGLSVDSMKAELRVLLDAAARARLNAIIFQVRPSADALYASKLEPWSYYLTGVQGRAPAPSWDPLRWAIAESHARGMELHAWFNPYRSRHPSDKSPRAAPSHVSRAHPTWNRRYGTMQWMDPGVPAVRQRTVNVILDVVQRYDVDGVHMDDYFYPYPERTRRGRRIPFPDDASYRAYQRRGGTLARDDWRRANVDGLVGEIYEKVKATKPWVKVGISPFGIWRPGYPETVSGFDQYEELYADARLWLNKGWIDYFTPQLYWKLGAPQQPYGDLLAWWRGENLLARHVWPGNYTGRASARRNVTWPVSEIIDQVQETRRQLGALSGNVHFPLNAFVANTDALVDRMTAGVYAEPALIPASPWLSSGESAVPAIRVDSTADGIQLTIEPSVFSTAAVPAPPATGDATRTTRPTPPRDHVSDARWWVVRARYADAWSVWIADASTTMVRLANGVDGAMPAYVTVSAIDRSGQESAAKRVSW
ncbi:MAG: family 10 glycosylhydrolase [Gemmatimonadaceae bacterium]|nr:family 10 glycosylhydrolase [Gemmatimonadaceae bacterium]